MERAMTWVGHGPTRAATRRMPPQGEQSPVNSFFRRYLVYLPSATALWGLGAKRPCNDFCL